VIVGKPPTRDELSSMVGRLLSLDRPVPEEVADVMYAMMKASLGRGCGDPGDMKELLVSAACAWSDAERQQYMRGMLDVLKQQNRARKQTGGIGPGATAGAGAAGIAGGSGGSGGGGEGCVNGRGSFGGASARLSAADVFMDADDGGGGGRGEARGAALLRRR
jgi:hypothetical protein